MQRLRSRGWLLSSVLTLSCLAAEPPVAERTLQLSDCLQMALEKNLDIRIQRMSPEIAGYNLGIAYSAYEPSFTGSLTRDGMKEPGGLDPQKRIVPGSESDTDTWRAGIGGLLPWGMSYSLGAGMGDSYGRRFLNFTNVVVGGITNQVPVFVPFEFSSGQMGFFTLKQPLLRGAWIDDARLSIQLSRANLRGSELALRRQIMATAAQVERTYYNVVAAQDSVRVSEKALELAERLLAENRKRVEVGALAPLDEKQAEAEVASRKADLLSTRRLFEDQQNLLKGLMTDDYGSWQGLVIRPASRLSSTPVSLQLSDSWLVALTQRPEILESQLGLQKQDITIKYNNNQLYPQFDLVGSYGFVGGGTSREYSDVLKQWDSGDNPTYSLGAQVTIPLGNRAARNNLRAAKATREQLLLSLKKLEQSIMVEVDNAIGQVRSSFERVGATKEARGFAEAALEAEQKKLENGKSTSFEVLRLQRDLVSAAYSEIRALADYNIALADLAQAEATTLKRLNLDIEIR